MMAKLQRADDIIDLVTKPLIARELCALIAMAWAIQLLIPSGQHLAHN